MVFETSQRVSQAKALGYKELGENAVTITLMDVRNNTTFRVTRVEYLAPARSVCVSEDGARLVEYMGNVVAVSRAERVVWAAEFARDVRSVWWIGSHTVGVVTNAARGSGVLTLFVIDVSKATGDNGTERLIGQLDLSVRDQPDTRAIHVAVQGSLVTCTVDGSSPDTSLLWYWRIDHSTQSNSRSICVADCGPVGTECTSIVGLRWINSRVGLAATRSGGHWFSLDPQVRIHNIACNLQNLDTLSWRWQQSVIVANKQEVVPPDTPILCLPGPAGMSFYRLDTKTSTSLRPQLMFPKNWVWLCASHMAYVILSPCRRKATVCKMPMGQPVYTVKLCELDKGADVIQDGWMVGDEMACVLSTGTYLYFICFA
ncbi:hypothetical protein GGH97_005119 [Coemansia sp. RSA 475]|nr:hypothetical protein GGH97_005119 [Coemansia sp. RSA 475]